MTIAYFDCFGGASGDMIVGALLDAGLRLEELRAQLKRLGLPGYKLSLERVTRAGLAGVKFNVDLTDGDALEQPPEGEPAHEHEHPHDHAPDHDHPHEHAPGHEHTHEHAGEAAPAEAHVHGHRNVKDIFHLLDHAALPTRADLRARRIFQRLAQAEAKVHHCAVEDVHFHEVGAVDSILDIVGACVGLEILDVERVLCSPIPLGSGTVRCEHGLLPVPAPATALLMVDGAVAPSEAVGELCTPTGAAILTTLAEGFGPLPPMRLRAVGHGAGQRDDPGRANLLRLFLGQEDVQGEADTVVELSANIDDTTGQVLGAVVEMLLGAGALDAWTAPIAMKKSRPAVMLGVLCMPADAERLEEIIFRQTTTIGIRRHTARRRKLSRQMTTVETPYGPVRVKVSTGASGEEYSATPEFDDCLAAAQAHHVPLKEVQFAALELYRRGGGR